jgi:drug/metabolite transporter (DMT)-like permease
MNALVYSAVIASAFLHALWNALLRREAEPEIAGAGFWLVCAAGAILSAVPSLLVAMPTLPQAAWSAAAGGFEAVYVVSLSRALARAPLGPVYTISRGGALVVVWPLSVLLLGEAITSAALAGTVLVAAGLAVTGLASPRRALARGGERGWLVLASMAAAAIAGYHLCYKQALAAGAAPPVVFAIALGLAGPINVLRLAPESRRRLGAAFRARPAILLAGGALAAGSFLIFLFALARGGAGFVLTLRNTSILFAQAMAWAIGERPTRAGIIGALAVALGAVFLGMR